MKESLFHRQKPEEEEEEEAKKSIRSGPGPGQCCLHGDLNEDLYLKDRNVFEQKKTNFFEQLV